MTDRMFDRSPTPLFSSNLHFDTWLDYADVPLKFARRYPDIPSEEIKCLYVEPFTDAVIPRCAFQSFVITTKGYSGPAPSKTQIRDLACILLEGGYVPFILRPFIAEAAEQGKNFSDPEYYTFIEESYIHHHGGKRYCAPKDPTQRCLL